MPEKKKNAFYHKMTHKLTEIRNKRSTTLTDQLVQ